MTESEKIMKRAREMVARYHQNGNKLPRSVTTAARRQDPLKEQEYKDAQKIKNWKKFLKNQSGGNKLPDTVKLFLDKEMPGWRYSRIPEDSQDSLLKAEAIVNRYRTRGFLLPREHSPSPSPGEHADENHSQSSQDVRQLRHWLCMEDMHKTTVAVVAALTHLDTCMPGWRECVLNGSSSSTGSSSSSSSSSSNTGSSSVCGYTASASNKKEEGAAIFDAILLQNSSNNKHVVHRGERGLDKAMFCQWFVRFRGEESRRVRVAGASASASNDTNTTEQSGVETEYRRSSGDTEEEEDEELDSGTDSTLLPLPLGLLSDPGMMPLLPSSSRSRSRSGGVKRNGEGPTQTAGRKKDRR